MILFMKKGVTEGEVDPFFENFFEVCSDQR